MKTIKQLIYMFSLTFSVILFIILIDYSIAFTKHLSHTNMLGLEVNINNFLWIIVIFIINLTQNIIMVNDKN
jgi:hypothetical protein